MHSFLHLHLNFAKSAISFVKNINIAIKNAEFYADFRFLDADLKVHKIEKFFDSDFEFCVISLLVMLKY
jgi:hypothetical protein